MKTNTQTLRNLRLAMTLASVAIAALLTVGCSTAPADADASNAAAVDEPSFIEQLFGRKVDVPAGTTVAVRMDSGLTSDTASSGERISATIARDVSVDGTVVIPAGSKVTATVTDVHRAKKIGGKARLGLDFHTVDLPNGESLSIDAPLLLVGNSNAKKDATAIGGGAAAGAAAGQLIEGDSEGTAAGAVIGGAIGSVIAARNKPKAVGLGTGSVIELHLENSVSVPIKS